MPTRKVNTYINQHPPKKKPTEQKMELSEVVKQLPKPSTQMSDLNAHSMDWGSSITDRWGTAVQDIIEQDGLLPHEQGKHVRNKQKNAWAETTPINLEKKQPKQK